MTYGISEPQGMRSYQYKPHLLLYLAYIMGLGPNENMGKIGGHSPKHCEQISNLHQVNSISIQFTTPH